MKIVKYGNLNRVGKNKRVKVTCPECGTVMILEEDEYRLGQVLNWSYRAEIAPGFRPYTAHKDYGREVIFECPMCGRERYGRVYWVSKLRGKYYGSRLGRWYGDHKIGMNIWHGFLAISGGIALAVWFLIVCLA